MTASELARFLKEKVPNHREWFGEHPDDTRVDILSALDAAVRLLREAERIINLDLAAFAAGVRLHDGENAHKIQFHATLRLVVGEKETG